MCLQRPTNIFLRYFLKLQKKPMNQEDKVESNFGFYVLLVTVIFFVGFVVFIFYKLRRKKLLFQNIAEVKVCETKSSINEDNTKPIQDTIQNNKSSQKSMHECKTLNKWMVCSSNKGLRMCEFSPNGDLVKIAKSAEMPQSF